MITYKEGNLSQVDDATRSQLLKLTLSARSVMREPIIRNLPKVVVIAYDGETPVGWVMHIDSRNIPKGETRERWLAYIGVFVTNDYRNRGIGRELVDRIGKILKPRFEFLVLIPHDENSNYFFKKIGTKQWRNYPEDEFTDAFGRRIRRLEETDHKVDMGTFKRVYFVGIINKDGEILGSETAFNHEILLGWIPKMYGFDVEDKRWRMDKDDDIVRWYKWGIPTNVEKDLVEQFLKKQYNVKVKGHALYSIAENKLMTEIKSGIVIGFLMNDDTVYSSNKYADHGDLWYHLPKDNTYQKQFKRKWRYNPKLKTVYWWDDWTKNDGELVQDHLKIKYGYGVIYQIPIDVKGNKEYNKRYKDAHGLKENIKVMIKQLIKECIKEKLSIK